VSSRHALLRRRHLRLRKNDLGTRSRRAARNCVHRARLDPAPGQLGRAAGPRVSRPCGRADRWRVLGHRRNLRAGARPRVGPGDDHRMARPSALAGDAPGDLALREPCAHGHGSLERQPRALEHAFEGGSSDPLGVAHLSRKKARLRGGARCALGEAPLARRGEAPLPARRAKEEGRAATSSAPRHAPLRSISRSRSRCSGRMRRGRRRGGRGLGCAGPSPHRPHPSLPAPPWRASR
jgi:hypothetical protein